MKSLALFLTSPRPASTAALPIDARVDATAGPPDVRIPSDVYLEPGLHDQPKPLKDGAELKVLKYGSYRVPAMGSLENRMAFALARPSTSCYIVGIQANLIYSSSGKVGNIDEGGWYVPLFHIAAENAASRLSLDSGYITWSSTRLD
jgi:hypothetical protein